MEKIEESQREEGAATTPSRPLSVWPLIFVIGLLLALGALGMEDITASERDSNGAVRFQYSPYALMGELGYSAVVLAIWWYYYRRSRSIKLHLLMLALALLLPISHISNFLNYHVLVDDAHCEWNIANATGTVRYEQVKQVDYLVFVNADGDRRIAEVRFMLKNGQVETIGGGLESQAVMKRALPEILERARQAGIRVNEVQRRV